LPRLRLNGNISFIFDTGADTSLLMPLDAWRIGVNYAELHVSERSLGIGGVSTNFIEPAFLAFVGDGELYGYEIQLGICSPTDEIVTIPSLLGRDIIDYWRVTYSKPELRLVADVVAADARQAL